MGRRMYTLMIVTSTLLGILHCPAADLYSVNLIPLSILSVFQDSKKKN